MALIFAVPTDDSVSERKDRQLTIVKKNNIFRLHRMRFISPRRLFAPFELAFSQFVVTVTVAQTQLAPFVVAPMVEGLGFCSTGQDQANMDMAIIRCEKQGDFGAKELQTRLEQLEPGGARGQVQVGYTLVVNLLTLLDKNQPDPMAAYTQALRTIDRPVVLYLFANHFATTTLKKPLRADSLARFADQSIAAEKYFDGAIAPVNQIMAPELEVNRRRMASLAVVTKWYKNLPKAAQDRVMAITMAGELHHFYDDFSNGMGRFDGIRITDYSPASVVLFQSWLSKKYQSIEKLNTAIDASYKSFEQVVPPSQNIATGRLDSIFQHFDSSAHGVVQIDGWLERIPAGHNLNFYVNGRLIGPVEYGLNRQDVYQAVQNIKTAGVGFRYLFDFSKLARGRHTLQVMVDGPHGFEVARRQLSVMGRSQENIPDLSQNIPAASGFKKYLKQTRLYLRDMFGASTESQPLFYLDRPADNLAVFFNPLAREWYDFRAQQIIDSYDAWFDNCVRFGLPGHKLYTHQIAVATVGGWNPLLFASDASIKGVHRYKKGINLYGGSANVELLQRLYLNRGERFGVPEFHTQAWKDPAAPLRVLKAFQQGGADFVTPYFLSLAPDKYRSSTNDHDKFRLSPDNPLFGSNHLYQAIVDLAKN